MGMVVRTNVPAMNAQRQLGINSNQVSKSLEKLSSGFRINRAADDASGLAISEKMKAQIKGLETASANSQDGISLIQTAEGGAQEIHDMLNRMTELATKSANGTIQNEVDREAIQREVDDLNAEITRISKSTNFNGINLLDGNLSGGAQGSGAVTGGTIASFKPGTTGDVAGKDMSTFASFANKETIKIDGVDIEVDWSKLDDNEQAAIKKDWTDSISTSDATKAADILQKTINSAIDAANKTRGTNVSHVTVKGSQTGGVASFKISSGMENSKDSGVELSKTADGVMGQMINDGTASVKGSATFKMDLGTLTANNTVVVGGKTYKMVAGAAANPGEINISAGQFDSQEKFMAEVVRMHNADATAMTSISYDATAKTLTTTEKTATAVAPTVTVTGAGASATIDATKSVTGVAHADATNDIKVVAEDKFKAGDVADINGKDFDMVLGGEKFNINVTGISSDANMGENNAKAIKASIDATLDKYITAKGLNAEEGTALKNNITVEFTKDGKFNITNNTGMTLAFQDKGGEKAAELLGIGGETGKVTSGGLTLQIGDTGDDFNRVTVSVDDLSAKGIGTEGINVGDQDHATAAIDKIKTAINKVSTNRANLGSLQNRLEHTINNLDTTAENMTSANSRIRDTDMAKEMMNYTKMNVLTQAAQAMLAQANQAPQAILQLLQ